MDDEFNFVTAEDIARLLSLSKRHVAERITNEPGFPKPFVFKGRGARRWQREEVTQWIRNRQLRG